MWYHMAAGDCDTLTDTWATLTLPYWTDKKKDSKIQTSDPLLHTQSCTVTWATWRGNPLMMYLWLTSYASLWRGKQVLLSVEEEQRGSEAQQRRKKASWGDTSGEPVETSADSKVFLMSPSQSQKMPWSQDKNKNKIWKKTKFTFTPGKLYLLILWQARSPQCPHFLRDILWFCFTPYTSGKEQSHFDLSWVLWLWLAEVQ